MNLCLTYQFLVYDCQIYDIYTLAYAFKNNFTILYFVPVYKICSGLPSLDLYFAANFNSHELIPPKCFAQVSAVV